MVFLCASRVGGFLANWAVQERLGLISFVGNRKVVWWRRFTYQWWVLLPASDISNNVRCRVKAWCGFAAVDSNWISGSGYGRSMQCCQVNRKEEGAVREGFLYLKCVPAVWSWRQMETNSVPVCLFPGIFKVSFLTFSREEAHWRRRPANEFQRAEE